VGWAFQVTDDILDVAGDATLLGKEVGRDAQLEKVTYPALLGMEIARQRAVELMQKGINALIPLTHRAERLRQIAEYVVMRNV
jgi:geranylgeranyl pyrophosphate synthase